MGHRTREFFQGFAQLTREERISRLEHMGVLPKDDAAWLSQNQSLSPHFAETFIENAIGYFPIPLGVATDFRIDGKDYVIPMAVEETSVIAGLSKAARWIRRAGYIETAMVGNTVIGQIQLASVKDVAKAKRVITHHAADLITQANESIAAGLVRRGGGVKELQLRCLPRDDGDTMLVIHVYVDCVDAMGANTVTQICEFLKTPIQKLTGETVTMCILSNLNDSQLARARVTITSLPKKLANKLAEASLFASMDPYRAATSNKGVLNGIDAVLIATGNDWRAVDAGIHAYASRSGQYRAITHWQQHGDTLVGELEAPIVVGTVGGVTRLHPTAKLCLQMLGVTKAEALSRVLAAVGLVQNLAAIRALCTEGIIKGHMRLHIDNLSMQVGATDAERPILKRRLEALLIQKKPITLSSALAILQALRSAATH